MLCQPWHPPPTLHIIGCGARTPTRGAPRRETYSGRKAVVPVWLRLSARSRPHPLIGGVGTKAIYPAAQSPPAPSGARGPCALHTPGFVGCRWGCAALAAKIPTYQRAGLRHYTRVGLRQGANAGNISALQIARPSKNKKIAGDNFLIFVLRSLAIFARYDMQQTRAARAARPPERGHHQTPVPSTVN